MPLTRDPLGEEALAHLAEVQGEVEAQGRRVGEAAYDLVVVGATPGGIACAVRAAREGLSVLLVGCRPHLGGMISGGIGVMDTQFDGRRAPLYDEVCDRIKDYYRTTYGAASEQYQTCLPGPRSSSGNRLTFEPRVGEQVLLALIAEHPTLVVLKPYLPVAVERAGRLLTGVRLRSTETGQELLARGHAFADGTYEADLASLAGVSCRLGREGRSEYGEPHAGRIFTVRHNTPGGVGGYPRAARDGALNLRPFVSVSQEIFAGSTGEGDEHIQAYHFRLCVSRDPANRRYPEPPEGYDPGFFREWFGGVFPRVGGNPLPNQKGNWWVNFSGESHAYPRASWEDRAAIERRFRAFNVGVLYFLQNDETVPDEVRGQAREWGLARDEFADNDNVPYELYVREARRIVGRYVFTEHDASVAPHLERTPVHHDSIAMAEWFMDSHEVSRERQPGSAGEELFLLSEKTRPSQIPYRCVLPQDLDNLLVPVCLSATHVSWGTLRLEPVWMHVGEAAGFAAALAIRSGATPGTLNVELLQRTLVERRLMISFFNDLDAATDASWVAAVQYLGSKGFFSTYDARPADALTSETARVWARIFGSVVDGAAGGGLTSSEGDGAFTVAAFLDLLAVELSYRGRDRAHLPQIAAHCGLAPDAHLTRGDACRLLYEAFGVSPPAQR